MRPLLASVLLALATLIAPSTAHANQCDAGRPMLSNREIPIGCPIRAYIPATHTPPVLEVMRTARVDVTGTVTAVGSVELPVHYDAPDFANECNPTTSVEPYTYLAYDVTFTANVGETIELNQSYYRTATVVAAGPCPAPEEYLNGSNWIQCSAGVQEFQACHDMLCTPFASNTADCEGTGSNDLPLPPDDGSDDDAGCAASTPSLGALGGPIALLVVALARYRRRKYRQGN